ncbi:hypothetical protein [Shewanella surugensis]|uniref:Uncharacterized protein n=1 Tax=Shewanella surugensis TaxID=212020 RepID=A0ABT0LI29_9GAMM|nr:hypothetical protein [Shewanella surugensis]MCL1127346.1 hypothetical protein [Shewanella surugensis]
MGSVVQDMIEIEYTIGELKTAMFVVQEHRFYLIAEKWITAVDLNVGDKIVACDGTIAEIARINPIEVAPHYGDLRGSHNHHYFVTFSGANEPLHNAVNVSLRASIDDRMPTNPLERISYELASRPSKFADGQPTGNHSGPWVAARYLGHVSQDRELSKDVIGWGCATDSMCAEDAALYDLQHKLGDAIKLHRGNVEISHAYIRKYTRKGRFVNKMSPCLHCRANYGSALNDTTLGESHLYKAGRGFLPHKP